MTIIVVIFAACVAVGILVAVTLGLRGVYLARRAAPAWRVTFLDTAVLFFSLAAFWAAILLGGYVATTDGIPGIGWIVIPALRMLSICLLLGGVIGGVVVFRRSRPLVQRADAEDHPSES